MAGQKLTPEQWGEREYQGHTSFIPRYRTDRELVREIDEIRCRRYATGSPISLRK